MQKIQTCKNIPRYVRNLDQFGHKVHLNFDQEGEIHKTLFGGFITIIFIGGILYYTGTCIQAMVGRTQSNYSSLKKPINPEELGLVNINQTGLSFYLIVSNYGGYPNYTFDQFKQFYDVSFNYSNTTNGLNPSGKWDYQRIEVKECTQNDVGQEQSQINFFNEAKNNQTLLLCPDLQKNQTFALQGICNYIYASNTTSYIKMQINKCDQKQINDNNLSIKCGSEQEFNEYSQNINFVFYSQLKQINFNLYQNEPVYKRFHQIQYVPLGYNQNYTVSSYIRLNTINTTDDYIQINPTTYSGTFFDIDYTTIDSQPTNDFSVTWYIQLGEYKIEHQRTSYNIMSILGQVGGVLGILQTLCMYILAPMTQFSFKMKAFKKLYLASTERNDLFKLSQSKNKYILDEGKHANIDHITKREIKNNKIIRLTLKDFIILFLSRLPIGCCFQFCWQKYKPFYKLFEEGSTRLLQEMDILQILKDLRQLKILLKNELQHEDLKLLIQHDKQNLLDIDDYNQISQNEDQEKQTISSDIIKSEKMQISKILQEKINNQLKQRISYKKSKIENQERLKNFYKKGQINSLENINQIESRSFQNSQNILHTLSIMQYELNQIDQEYQKR